MSKRERGISIVELMVSLTLGLMILMAVAALLISSKFGYVSVDDSARIQDTGRYALENIARSVRQASYTDWNQELTPILSAGEHSADIRGLDASSLSSTTPQIEMPIQKSINGSDVLVVRYFGSGAGENGDGTVLNCAGFGVGAVQSSNNLEEGRGWSIFYVAADSSGEPELRCKYRGKNNWTSEAIARGVESFQVLYGIDTDADGLPNRFINANAVNQLDELLILKGENSKEKELDKNRKTNWKKVVAVKVGLLVRGSQNSRIDVPKNEYHLFGTEYSYVGVNDTGVSIKEEKLQASVQRRQRRIFQQTIMLRNSQMGNKA